MQTLRYLLVYYSLVAWLTSTHSPFDPLSKTSQNIVFWAFFSLEDSSLSRVLCLIVVMWSRLLTPSRTPDSLCFQLLTLLSYRFFAENIVADMARTFEFVLNNLCFLLFLMVMHCDLIAHGDLVIPRTFTMTFGPRGFPVSGPTAWNSLPTHLKNKDLSFLIFKPKLKTHLFSQAPCS